MLIKSVVQNEAVRNEKMIQQYEDLISNLPKGSLICRREYYYLKYRNGKQICDEYIGKDAQLVAALREKLELRQHYIKMLAALKYEQKAIYKLLEVLS